MKNQLLLAYSFPPVANAESIVTARMVRALHQQGWQSLVCTVNSRWNTDIKDPGLIDILPDKVKIFRSTPLPFIRLSRILQLLRLNLFAQLSNSLPDNSIYWYPMALRNLKRILQSQKIDVIHSRAMPLAGHFLGLYAKKKSGLPWIVHFCDPWINGPYYSSKWSFLTKLHAHWEKQFIGMADAVTFTTEAARNIVMAKYPVEWIDKCHVIPHGYMVYPGIKKDKSLLDGRYLNIVYTGSFYGTRSPDILFQALKKLKQKSNRSERLRIWLIGRMHHQRYADLAKRYGIENVICLKESVPYQKALAYANEADVLLSINSVSKEPDLFLESKLIDYFGFNKPILGIVYPSGKTAGLLLSTGCFVADLQNATHVSKILKLILGKWEKGKLTAPRLDEPEIQQYKIESTIAKLASILDAVSENRPSIAVA